MSDTVTTVDMIPKLSPTGDFLKVKDEFSIDINNRILTLLNLLEYEDGKNSIFTEMGIYKELHKIPYSENTEEVLENIKFKISSFLNFQVDISHEYDADRNVILKITVENLPGYLSMKMRENNGFVKIINPKYIK